MNRDEILYNDFLYGIKYKPIHLYCLFFVLDSLTLPAGAKHSKAVEYKNYVSKSLHVYK